MLSECDIVGILTLLPWVALRTTLLAIRFLFALRGFADTGPNDLQDASPIKCKVRERTSNNTTLRGES